MQQLQHYIPYFKIVMHQSFSFFIEAPEPKLKVSFSQKLTEILEYF